MYSFFLSLFFPPVRYSFLKLFSHEQKFHDRKHYILVCLIFLVASYKASHAGAENFPVSKM